MENKEDILQKNEYNFIKTDGDIVLFLHVTDDTMYTEIKKFEAIKSKSPDVNNCTKTARMAGMHGIFFYPEGEINKIKPKRSSVVCYCCKSCGLVQRLQLERLQICCRK